MNKDEIKKVLENEYEIHNINNISLFRSSPDNDVFKVEADDKMYAVRLGKKTTANDMLYEATLLANLLERGVLVPEVISTVKGQEYSMIEKTPVIVSRWVEGIHPAIPADVHFSQIGKWLGDFHRKGQSIDIGHSRKRNLLSEIKDFLKHQDVFLGKTTNGGDILSHIKEVTSVIKDVESDEGIIHNDLRPHNVLFLEDGTLSAVLDFDWACAGALQKDVAHTIMEWTCPDGAKLSCKKEGIKLIYDAYEKASGIKMNYKDLALWAEFSGIADACTYWMRVIVNNQEIIMPIKAESFMYNKAIFFSEVLRGL